MSQTFLGFDYGERHTGVAVGSTFSGQAQPVATLSAKGNAPDWGAIDRLIAEWKPHGLVVGLPLNMDGSRSRLTTAARAFGENLRARYNLPVHMVDERLSSRVATDTLLEAGVPLKRHKQRIDQVAAQTVLQAFLNDYRPAP